METKPATITVCDQPQAWDNNGREQRILAALRELPLAVSDLCFSRALDRMNKWRIVGAEVSPDRDGDLAAIVSLPKANGCNFVATFGEGIDIEWNNYGR